MTHGQVQVNSSTTTVENVEPNNRGESSQAVNMNGDPASQSQEEKRRVFDKLEQVMDIFRNGESTRFQMSIHVLNELDKWRGVTNKEKENAFNSYIKINSNPVNQDEPEIQSTTREESPLMGTSLTAGQKTKRIRDKVEELLDQVSRDEPEGEDDEPRVIRR